MSKTPGSANEQSFDPTSRLVFGLGLILGLAMLLLSPPFSVPDERNHFWRAYHLSEGKLFAHREHGDKSKVGDMQPESLWNTVVALHANVSDDRYMYPSLAKTWAAMRIPLVPEKRCFRVFPNTALYSPVPYAPAASAIALSRYAGATPLMMFYCARAVNLITFLLLASWAVQATPILRSGFAMMAFLPVSLYWGASLSADSFTLGITLCAMAATFAAALQTDKISLRDLARLAMLFGLLALCKQAYAPLTLMFFIIPSRNCGGWMRYLAAAALVVGVPIALNLAWGSMVKSIYSPMMPGVDPIKHLHYTLSRPFGYTCDIVNVMHERSYWLDMVGILGWRSVELPTYVRVALWLALAASAVLDGNGIHRLTGQTRLILVGLFLLTFATILTLVNLSWQVAGVRGIVGVQARYFAPLFPLMMAVIRVDVGLPYARFFARLRPFAIISVALLASIASWVALFQLYYR